MTNLSLDSLGEVIIKKRNVDGLGVRAAAKEIGISSATLSRVENGYLPDLKNFTLICDWLDINPDQILGFQSTKKPVKQEIRAQVHYKKKSTGSKEMAEALTHVILAAKQALNSNPE
jgi:transcriptional regulator with XRE-family HTH domain